MKKIMWLLPVIALVISCGGEEEVDNYFPLATGNTWTYDMVYRMILVDTTAYTGTSTTEITRETTLNNNVEVFEQVTTMIWDDTTMMTNSVDTTYIQETDDYILIFNDPADIDPDTSLALPIEQGNVWIVYADSADTMTAEVVGPDTVTVTVPAGTYDDCWHVVYTSVGQAQHNWFALDVGIVKHFMYIVEQNVTIEFTKELTDFDVQ